MLPMAEEHQIVLYQKTIQKLLKPYWEVLFQLIHLAMITGGNSTATIIAGSTDISASNGIIHVIDAVLLP